jgi:signal-transduction protein with cAMP-binding, CBS, and nucleotidyltransferase domain
MHALTAIFFEPVRSHMATDPLIVEADATCLAVVERMSAIGASSALVVDAERRLVGIVTERDVTRRIAFKLERNAVVQRAMTAPVQSIRDDDLLYRAIARMRRHGLRHLPVVDRAGRVVGLFGLDVALARGLARQMELIERIAREDSVAGMGQVKAAQVDLAAALLEESLPVAEVQALLSGINLDMHRRIAALTLEAMAQDGWGEAPVPFSVIVMGSGGRGESLLVPDQDNGLILEDYPDAEHVWVDRFFIEFAERMAIALSKAGFPLCRGNVMASNPLWRKSLSQWQRQIERWVAQRSNVAILNADICFDFRSASGPARLAAALRRHVLGAVAGRREFLREMCLALLDHKVALGLFGGFATEEAGDGKRVNLKLRGTIPLVSAVRLLALREGVPETSTLARLATLQARGVLSTEEFDSLGAAYRYLSELLLRQQLADFRAGRRAVNLVAMGALSRARRNRLTESLRAVDSLQTRVRHDFTGQIL